MQPDQFSPYSIDYDLSNCDKEPLHLIRSYQAPAVLIVIDMASQHIVAVSENANQFWDTPPTSLIGQPLAAILPKGTLEQLKQALEDNSSDEELLVTATELKRENFPEGANLIFHRFQGMGYCELEPIDDKLKTTNFLQKIDQVLVKVQTMDQTALLYETIVTEIKQLTNYDRVWLYQFDEEYNGEIIGEAKETDMPPYLHLRYPHTDIPAQARALYLRTPFRHITSTSTENGRTIIFHPELAQLDLSPAYNRGASPIHQEYLRNIGVGASLSIPIIVDQKLWGLIACHHRQPKIIDYRLRSILGLFSRVISGQLALRQANTFRNNILKSSIQRSKLFERMTEQYNILQTLKDHSDILLALTNATGAIIFLDDELHLLGQTPKAREATMIVDWLKSKSTINFHTSNLYQELPEAKAFSTSVAGLLSIQLSENPGEYIIWLKPEIVTTITWGGNPEKRKLLRDGKIMLHPEMSFAKYVERVEGSSTEWKQHEIKAALSLRSDIKEIILKKYHEIRILNNQISSAYEELETFSYTVSHDLRAPLRNIRGFAEILQEDYEQQLDKYGKEALITIINSVGRMNSFIDDILTVSKLGQTKLIVDTIELLPLINEIWQELQTKENNAVLKLNLEAPTIAGDYVQIKQLLSNLIANAVKYSSQTARPIISIASENQNDQTVVKICDNGIGFDMQYAGRIFSIFDRLVSQEEFEGTGVGLAIVKRITDRHQGKITAESTPGQGACFTLALPHTIIDRSYKAKFKK